VLNAVKKEFSICGTSRVVAFIYFLCYAAILLITADACNRKIIFYWCGGAGGGVGGGVLAAAASKTLFFPPCGKLRVSDQAGASG